MLVYQSLPVKYLNTHDRLIEKDFKISKPTVPKIGPKVAQNKHKLISVDQQAESADS